MRLIACKAQQNAATVKGEILSDNIASRLHPFNLFVLVLLGGLGIGMVPARADWVVYLGSGTYWVQPAAVTRTVDQFLGRPPGGGGGTPGAGGSGIGGTEGSVRANGPLTLRGHYAVALGWRGHVALHPRFDLVGSVRLEHARTRWFVRGGIDILRDDLSARIAHLAVTPTLALRTALPAPPNWRADISAGLGADVVWTRTRISSALLDVRRSDRFSEGFAFTQLGLGHARFPDDRLVLDLEWRDSIDIGVRLGIEHRF
jgi:hypothetical protein